MKAIVDELPKSTSDCMFSKYCYDDGEDNYFHNCILREAYIDKKCVGYDINGYIHCRHIQSFSDMYKSQMKMRDCVVKVDKDDIPDIWNR